MKTAHYFFILFLFTALSANAQKMVEQSIGLRLGGENTGNSFEASYQMELSKVNRLEANFGFGSSPHASSTAITGVYQWWFPLENSFNWYAGPAAQLGYYKDKDEDENSGMGLYFGGQVGIEYDLTPFDYPVLISFDLRPMLKIVGTSRGVGYGVALSVRYVLD